MELALIFVALAGLAWWTLAVNAPSDRRVTTRTELANLEWPNAAAVTADLRERVSARTPEGCFAELIVDELKGRRMVMRVRWQRRPGLHAEDVRLAARIHEGRGWRLDSPGTAARMLDEMEGARNGR